MSEKMLASWREYQDHCAPVIVKYYSPGPMRGCHNVACAYYGEHAQKLVNHCEAPSCHPGPPVDVDKKTYEYVKKLSRGHRAHSIQLAKGNCDLLKYDKEMTALGLKHLMEWRENLWVRCRMWEESNISNLNPLNSIVTNHALNMLISAIHQATTEEHALEVLDQWMEISKVNLSTKERKSLIPIVGACNTHWKENIHGQKEAEMRKLTEVCKQSWVPGRDIVLDTVAEPTSTEVMEPTLAKVLGQTHTAGK